MTELLIQILPWLTTVALGWMATHHGKKYKELKEALKVTIDAIQDDKITQDEVEQIAKEWRDVFFTKKKAPK